MVRPKVNWFLILGFNGCPSFKMVPHKDTQGQVQEYILGHIYWIIIFVFQYVYIVYFIEKKTKVQGSPELAKAPS